jgi:Tfp pilus assembly protein PilP
MVKAKNKMVLQKNKNNKTKPENLMKKEYLESFEKLKKLITDDGNND